MGLFHASSTVVLIVSRSNLCHTAFSIIKLLGGRPVSRLREDCAPDSHL